MANVVAGNLPPGYGTHPTIYYEEGRLTVEHARPTDIGWKNEFTGGQCEFFGNVPLNVNVPEHPTGEHVERLRQAGTSYYSRRRQAWSNVVGDRGGRLIEVWAMGPVRLAHTSRNRFFWASTPLKSFLHQLAMSASNPPG
jgi:hypothetical protein